MKKYLVILTVLLLFSSTSSLLADDDVGVEIYRKNHKAVGAIMTVDRSTLSLDENLVNKSANGCWVDNYHFSGTGFFFDKDGYLLTNWHVKDSASGTARVIGLSRGINCSFPIKSYKFVGYDLTMRIAYPTGSCKVRDLAVFRVEGLKKGDFESVEFDPLYRLSPAEKIWIIGTPQNMDYLNSVSGGYVTGIGVQTYYSKQSLELGNLIQTDLPTSPGNSGSPIFDSNGKVVCIHTGFSSRGINEIPLENVKLEVPIDGLTVKLVERLKYGDVSLPDIGFVTLKKNFLRSQFGDESNVAQTVEDMQGSLYLGGDKAKKIVPLIKMKIDSYAFISFVDFFHEAIVKFKVGDCVIKIDDLPVTNEWDIQSILLLKNPGDEVKVTFLRCSDGKTVETLEEIVHLTEK